ncbi:MAG: hypothetical protein K5989_05680 [Lachnospiraceae bacterium]|nr:hypothetical protein [Lachnospiraceae bacterium]
MRELKLIRLDKDNILSFQKYLSETVLSSLTFRKEDKYIVAGALWQEDESMTAAGAAAIFLDEDNKVALIDSLEVEKEDPESYRVTMELLKIAVQTVKKMSYVSILCRYLSPGQEMLEAALYEHGFEMPEMENLMYHVSGDRVSAALSDKEYVQIHLGGVDLKECKGLVRLSELPDRQRNSLLRAEGVWEHILSEYSFAVMEGNSDRPTAVLLTRREGRKDVGIRHLRVDKGSEKYGVALIYAFLATLAGEKEENPGVVFFEDDIKTRLLYQFFIAGHENALETIEIRTMALSLLPDWDYDRRDELEQILDVAVPGSELLPRLNGLKFILKEELDIESDLVIDEGELPYLVFYPEDTPPITLTYDIIPALDEPDDYSLIIMSLVRLKEGTDVEELMKSCLQEDSMTGWVTGEDKRSVVLTLRYIEWDQITDSETLSALFETFHDDLVQVQESESVEEL